MHVPEVTFGLFGQCHSSNRHVEKGMDRGASFMSSLGRFCSEPLGR